MYYYYIVIILIYRMAKTTQWLNAILDYNHEEGEVEYINCVWPGFITQQLNLKLIKLIE